MFSILFKILSLIFYILWEITQIIICWTFGIKNYQLIHYFNAIIRFVSCVWKIFLPNVFDYMIIANQLNISLNIFWKC